VRAPEVRGEDRRHEAVDRIIGDPNGFFFLAEGDHRQDGAEDLLARDGGVGGDIGEDRRFDEVVRAADGHPVAAKRQPRLGTTLFDVGHHVAAVGRVHHRPHPGRGVERVAGDVVARRCHDLVEEAVGDGRLDQEPCGRRTDFALIVMHLRGQGGGAVLVLGIGKDDVRAFPAAFQPDRLHVRLRGIGEEALAGFGRAREGKAVHIHVQAQGLAYGRPESGHYVEHARGHARLGRQARQMQRGQR
jgi:hypothetical protein